ncbi:RhoGAP-domain-containing protein [Lichtheimia hyalospora FSU 10163]|nr:RhoGAP-domain-containing protein [Lichtheimia hyalospora FSU 10163]
MATVQQQHHHHQPSPHPPPPTQDPQPPLCIGCKNPIEEGSVIAFGDALFHFDCFTCAKCSLPVDCTSKLLLLADGRPVCENCSYVCVACKQTIRDEAVMTGEEAYHANCFKCVSCKRRIEDLVFTQTSKGIYCTPCNEYRRAQRQRRREEKERRQGESRDRHVLPSPSSSSPSRLSRMLDSQIASDYLKIQQALVRENGADNNNIQVRSQSEDSLPRTSSRQDQHRSPFFSDNQRQQPPTPNRSRSSSVEISNSNKSNSSNNVAAYPSRHGRPMPNQKSFTTPPSSGTASPAPNYSSRLSSIPSANSSAASLTQSPSSDSIYGLNDGVGVGGLSKGNLFSDTNSSPNEVPSLNLSFFDNDSSDLLNLTKSLGANLAVDINKTSEQQQQQLRNRQLKTKPSKSLASGASAKFSKATELLSSSLRQATLGGGSSNHHSNSTWNDFPQPPTRGLKSSTSMLSLRSVDSNSSEKNLSNDKSSVSKLQADLKASNAKVSELSTNFNKIKEASKRALDEFARAKEDFAKEVTIRQQHEYTILQLQQQITALSGKTNGYSPLNKEEIERMSKTRMELDEVCKQLKEYRDVLSADITNMAKQKQAGLESSATSHLQAQQKALLAEIKSLTVERDGLQTETKGLSQLREDIISEMVILHSQNAELTTMNNDLSRRVGEREREAAAVMAGTSFLYPSTSTDSRTATSPPAPMERKSSDISSDVRTVASRDSFNGTQAPKLFKMKKSPSNMFGRFANKSKTDLSNNGGGLYSMQNASVSTNSLMSEYPPRREVRQGSKQSQTSVLQGSHSFQPTAFIRPVKCGICFEKMWGLSEYRCQGCGLSIHGKCLSHAPQLCFSSGGNTELTSPLSDTDTPKVMSMFGNDLGAQAAQEGRSVPLIVQKCIEAVEARGMDYEGIYRKSGGAAQMRAIQVAFDQGEDVDLADEDEYNDICAVTSVLKQYFRELPNPPLTFELYTNFIDAVSLAAGPEKTDKFLELLSQLPKTNYDTLKMLIEHLQRVSQYSRENRMTSKNLALVFAPTLIRGEDSSRELLDMSYTNALMEYLISSAHELFVDDDESQ